MRFGRIAYRGLWGPACRPRRADRVRGDCRGARLQHAVRQRPPPLLRSVDGCAGRLGWPRRTSRVRLMTTAACSPCAVQRPWVGSRRAPTFEWRPPGGCGDRAPRRPTMKLSEQTSAPGGVCSTPRYPACGRISRRRCPTARTDLDCQLGVAAGRGRVARLGDGWLDRPITEHPNTS